MLVRSRVYLSRLLAYKNGLIVLLLQTPDYGPTG